MKEFFSNKEYPVRSRDLRNNEEKFSVDVVMHFEDGMLNIGYWNYDIEKWKFHADTITDPYEGGELSDFAWMYAPQKLVEYFDL